MPKSDLPDRPNLEFLRKLAKDRLEDIRRADPKARLAAAQLAVAREHGFTSWRSLKAEVDRRNAMPDEALRLACYLGNVDALRDLLDRDPAMANARVEGGSTPLHLAIRHPDAVRLLLSRGADPNARDQGDNALPLHFAAGYGLVETVRALLEGGSDVHGVGDDHHMDVIGWATVFAEPRRDIVALLLEHGARHNIFSAVATGEPDVVEQVVRSDPHALRRRLSRNEQEQTALHYVISPADGLVGGTFRTGGHYRMLERLIALGADVSAVDAKGRTPLDIAMLKGDREAMRLLVAAGAPIPEVPAGKPAAMTALAGTVKDVRPMIAVPDVNATVSWYQSIGFALSGSHGDDGRLDWASVTLGGAEVMFVPSAPWRAGALTGLSLWLGTDRIDDLYAEFRRRQLERSRRLLAGEEGQLPGIDFTADLHTAFYGQREFGIRDPNGVELMFAGE